MNWTHEAFPELRNGRRNGRIPSCEAAYTAASVGGNEIAMEIGVAVEPTRALGILEHTVEHVAVEVREGQDMLATKP